ncbi:MAG: response regulator [Desulfobacterales bacterium]|jgi:DNA-binding response OmpR family regulator
MTAKESFLKGIRILAVDDEEDILETIEEILDESRVDTARDYQSASPKIKQGRYDLAILDIMGVDGLKLLDEAVDRGIPTVMLTAHAISAETLMKSIQKGAISYLPKETLADLDDLLNEILGAVRRGEPPWKMLFEKLGDFFDKRFGPDWKEKDYEFWSEFSRSYQIGKGIQQRLKHDRKIIDKGI